MTGPEPTTPSIDLLLRHREWLQRLAASLVVDAAQADDLVQQTLLAALERPPLHASHPRAWLATVVRRLVRHESTQAQQRGERERIAARPEPSPSPDEIVAEAALQHEVSAAVLVLDEPYRTALLLRFASNLAPRAIAKRTGAPVETVRTRIKRGVELVRAELVRRRSDRGTQRGEWAVGLLGLLTPWGRRVVHRAIVAKAAGTSATIGSVSVTGVLGVLAMSTKLKLAAAGVVVACGTVAVVKLCERPGVPPSGVHESSLHAPPELPAPATAEAMPQPAIADATRAVEEVAPIVAEPAAAPSRLVLSGLVRTAAGGPASETLVVVEAVGPGSALGRLDDLIQNATDYLDLAPGSHGRIRSTLTGADGSFRFESVTLGTHVNVAAIDRKEGLGLASGLEFDAVRAAAPLEIVLLGGVVLRGRVSDVDGQPIVGAYGDVIAFAGDDPKAAAESFTRVLADTSGEYITLPLPFPRFYFEFQAEGYRNQIRAPVRIEVGERDHREDFTLLKLQAFGGRIVLANGQPAGLAKSSQKCLVLLSVDDPREGLLSPTVGIIEKGEILLDEDRYRFEERWSGAKFVSLWCEQTLLGSSPIEDEHVGPDLVVDLDALPPPSRPRKASLRFEVVDAEDGGPVLDFMVTVGRDLREEEELNPQPVRAESHDAGGRLEVPNLLLGRYDVALRAEGYAPVFLTARVSDDSNLAPVHVELCKAVAPLRGRVLDEQGQPIAQADVSLLAPDGRAAMPYPDYRARTGANGTFAFAAIPEGDYFVCAEAQGLAPSAAPATAGDEDVVLTLRAGVLVKLEGRFGGKTYWGANSIEIRDEQGAPVVDLARPGAWVLSRAVGQAPTRLAPGTYTLYVTAPGFHADPVRFTAAPGVSVTVDLVKDAPRPPGR